MYRLFPATATPKTSVADTGSPFNQRFQSSHSWNRCCGAKALQGACRNTHRYERLRAACYLRSIDRKLVSMISFNATMSRAKNWFWTYLIRHVRRILQALRCRAFPTSTNNRMRLRYRSSPTGRNGDCTLRSPDCGGRIHRPASPRRSPRHLPKLSDTTPGWMGPKE